MEKQRAVAVTLPLRVACLEEDLLSLNIVDIQFWKAQQKGVTGEKDNCEKRASEQAVALIKQESETFAPQKLQDAWCS